MTSTDPERCLDCGISHPGGGFCPSCLSVRMRRLSAALERAQEERERELMQQVIESD